MSLDQSDNLNALLKRASAALYEFAAALPISERRDQMLIDSTALETLNCRVRGTAGMPQMTANNNSTPH